jgi:hypothetical protein
MGPGQQAQVKLSVSGLVFDPSSPVRLLPPPPGVTALGQSYSYSYPQSGVSAEQRAYNRKVQLLNIGLEPLLSASPSPGFDVLALAWGPGSPTDFELVGNTSHADELNLWTTRFPVAGGSSNERLAVGSIPFSVYAPGNRPAWSLMTTGQLSPPAQLTLSPYIDANYRLPAGTKPDSLTLHCKLGLLPGEVEVLAYNVRTGAWDHIAALSGQVIDVRLPIPNAIDHTGPAGDVTVRLLATSGSMTFSPDKLALALNEGPQQ